VTPLEVTGLVGVSVIAGAVNSVAGGGTLFTFPTLLAAGFTPLAANGTNTVALVPGSAAAAWGYAHELAGRRKEVLALCTPSLVGGVLGAWLTRRAGNALFAKLVPWLILGATVLFILQEPLSRLILRRSRGSIVAGAGPLRLAGVALFQLLVAIYGGFFGAGMGIMILAALGQLGFSDVHEMNALKNIVAVCINGTATVTFILLGQVVWPVAGMMAAGAITGGYLGARTARKLGQTAVRRIVVLVGLGIAVWMFAKQL
jgi:hypothetical protein